MKKNRKNLCFKGIALILAMAIMLLAFSGCSKKSDAGENDETSETTTEKQSDKKAVKKTKGKITIDNLSVTNKDNISITFSEYDIDDKNDLTIERVNKPVLPEDLDASVTAYDFKLSKKDEFISLIDITIPYDAAIIESGENPENCVSSAYYNEDTKEWEAVPFTVDKRTGLVTITADHLSTYGVFTFKNEYTRKTTVSVPSYASYMNIRGPSSEAYTKVIEEIINNSGTPSEITLEHGFDITNEALGITGNGLTFITEAAYVTPLLEGIGNAFTALGVAGAVLQAAFDWNKDDKGLALKSNLTKNLSYLTIGKWGSSAAKLCSVGVFAIDYSLNEFGKEAWAGRNKLYKKAYKAYIEEKHPRLATELYRDLYAAYAENRDKPSDFNLKEETKKVAYKYCEEFWKDEGSLEIYLQEQGVKFTGYGGFSDDLVDELTNSAYVELMQTTMQTVLTKMIEKITRDLQNDYLKALNDVKNELNKKIKVNIYETKINVNDDYNYAEHKLKFAPLDENANIKNWSGALKKDATASTYFTLIGYLQSGAPNTLEVFKPEDDIDSADPVIVIPFTLKSDTLDIDLGLKAPTLDELVGLWDDTGKNTISLLALDAPWEAFNNIAENFNDDFVKEMEEMGCDVESDSTSARFNTAKQSIDGIKNNPFPFIFSITKINENTGTYSFVSFPGNDQSGGACENMVGMESDFTYDEGVLTFNYNKLAQFYSSNSDGQYSTEQISAMIKPGSGKLIAAIVKNSEGKDIITIDGNFDYYISLDQYGEDLTPLYVNYSIHGERNYKE